MRESRGVHPRRPLPPELLLGPFRVDEAAAAGVPRGRLRASDLAIPHRGVRVNGAPDASIEGRASAFLPLLAPDECFSHVTAALLQRMRTPLRLHDAPLHVTAVHATRPDGRRARRRVGIIGHRAQGRARAITLLGHPVTDPIATWIDLAGSLSIRELVVMGDGLVTRKRPAATMAQLRAAVDASTGVRGIRKLRVAIEYIRPRTDSGRETELRLVVLDAGIREPEINGEIRDADGTVIAHGDMLWRRERVILEYDGPQHFDDPWQIRIDLERIARLESLGWRVIRVDAALFARPEVFLPRLRAALATPR